MDVTAVWCGPLGGPPWVSRDADRSFPAASTFKAALVTAVNRAGVPLEDEVAVHDDFASAVAGERYVTTQAYDNDDEPWLRLGGTAPVGWLCERALVRSSNLATNLLLERVGTDAVTAVYDGAGATRCVVRRGIEDLPAAAAGLHNTVTAAGLAAFLATVPPAVEDLMARCEDTFGAAGLPPGTRFAHKPGWFEGVCLDHGILRPDEGEPFALVVLVEADGDDDALRDRLVDEVSRCWEARAPRR